MATTCVVLARRRGVLALLLAWLASIRARGALRGGLVGAVEGLIERRAGAAMWVGLCWLVVSAARLARGAELARTGCAPG